MISLYVYFRAPADGDAAVAAALARLQELADAEHGCRPRLLRRPELRDGMRTWMEIYEALDPATLQRLEHRLPSLVEASGLASLVNGERHVERFEVLDGPCA